MLRFPPIFIAFLLVAGFVRPAVAQMEGAPRSSGGVFGRTERLDARRSTQSLSLTFDIGSGYDQNLQTNDGSVVPIPGFNPTQSGFVTNAVAALRYQNGRVGKSIASNDRVYISRATTGAEQIIAGQVGLSAETELGRRNGINADISAAYEPTFLFDSFAPVAAQIEGGIPEATSGQGVTEQRWLSSQATASVFRNWTSRQRMDVRFGYAQRQPMNGIGYDSQSKVGSVRHAWTPRQSAGLDFVYQFNENRQDGPFGGGRPLRYQNAEVGLRLSKRLSPDRQVQLTFGGGAAESSSSPELSGTRLDFVLPTGYSTFRYDLSRTWSVAADTRRSISVLDGLSPEPFATTGASLRLNGVISRRLQLGSSASYAHGQSAFSLSGAYETVVGAVQMQYALARSYAIYTNYTFQRHELFDVTLLTPGFPNFYHLNSVRVGVTIFMPFDSRS